MLTPSFFPSIGGVETHVRRVSEVLSARDHKVTIITQAEEPGHENMGAMQVHRLPRTNWLAAWLASRRYITAADIVHCHDAYSFLHFYLPSCYLPPKRPVFITFHGYEGYPIPAEAVRLRHFVRRRVRDAICMGDFICKWYGTKCLRVSYGGVDPTSPPLLPEEPSALFLGRLAEDTSIMRYLEAISLLRNEYGQELPLIVAGDGPLRVKAEAYVKTHNLRVSFLGKTNDTAQLFVQTRFAFISGYLGIWQALAMKRLVFSVYENELKRDYLLGFPEAHQVMEIAGSASELAGQIVRHLADPSLDSPMLERGAQLAAEYPWERVADLYLEMYREHDLA